MKSLLVVSLLASSCVLFALLFPSRALACEPGPALPLAELKEATKTATSEAVKDAFLEPERLGLEDLDYDVAERSFVVAGHSFTPVTLRDGFERDVMLVREALGQPLQLRGMPSHQSGDFDPYGVTPKLVRLSTYDLVDGGDPELVVEYVYSTEGSCESSDDDFGDSDCEVEGPMHTAVAVLDTSLNVLAFARTAAESDDIEKFACHGQATFQDVNCDGRLELVVTSDCDESKPDRRWLSARVEVPIAQAQSAPAAPSLATESVHDDRPFLLIAGTWAETAPNARRQAELRAVELRDAGNEEAAVYDSRQFEELEWGYVTVIAVRTATKEEADDEAALLTDAYVKQGFFATEPLPDAGDCVSQVVARPRGYRLRVLQCQGVVSAELFNADGKRKSNPSLLTLDPAALKSAELLAVTDANGKPVAIAASLELATARAVLVVSADKTTPQLLYGAFVDAKAKVSVDGSTVSVTAGGLTRGIVVGSKKGEVTVTVSREAEGHLRVDAVGTFDVMPAELD